MCIVSAKITELWGRLNYQQGDTSWVWYYVSSVVGSLQIPYILALVVSAAGSIRRDLTSIPGRAEHRVINSSEILKFLLKTNDGRGRRPGWAILSATYASAKTRKRKGSISSHCLNGLYIIDYKLTFEKHVCYVFSILIWHEIALYIKIETN